MRFCCARHHKKDNRRGGGEGGGDFSRLSTDTLGVQELGRDVKMRCKESKKKGNKVPRWTEKKQGGGEEKTRSALYLPPSPRKRSPPSDRCPRTTSPQSRARKDPRQTRHCSHGPCSAARKKRRVVGSSSSRNDRFERVRNTHSLLCLSLFRHLSFVISLSSSPLSPLHLSSSSLLTSPPLFSFLCVCASHLEKEKRMKAKDTHTHRPQSRWRCVQGTPCSPHRHSPCRATSCPGRSAPSRTHPRPRPPAEHGC